MVAKKKAGKAVKSAAAVNAVKKPLKKETSQAVEMPEKKVKAKEGIRLTRVLLIKQVSKFSLFIIVCIILSFLQYRIISTKSKYMLKRD